jgi:hypothetical protein
MCSVRRNDTEFFVPTLERGGIVDLTIRVRQHHAERDDYGGRSADTWITGMTTRLDQVQRAGTRTRSVRGDVPTQSVGTRYH